MKRNKSGRNGPENKDGIIAKKKIKLIKYNLLIILFFIFEN